MLTFRELLQNFFTHKDFLPPVDQIPGTLFTPLHMAFALMLTVLVAVLCLYCRKENEKQLKRIFGVVWAAVLVMKIIKLTWETFCGAVVRFEWGSNLPLHPCGIFMYAMPFAVWGRGQVRRAACGYMCTLGLLGGLINFVYPANLLSNYSCLSFPGMHTLVYHGSMVFIAMTMLLSGYHKFTGVTRWWEMLTPAVPALAVSVVANLVNFSPVNSDYMFFKLNSFFLAPLGAATEDWMSVIIMYAVYLLVHGLPYLPSYIAHCRKDK